MKGHIILIQSVLEIWCSYISVDYKIGNYFDFNVCDKTPETQSRLNEHILMNHDAHIRFL